MPKLFKVLTLLTTALLIAAVQAFNPQYIRAQEIILENLVLDNVGGTIQLRFGIEVEDVASLRDYLDEGTTLRLKCDAELQQKKILWKDETVLSRSLVFDLKNNPLTQEYLLQNVTYERTIHGKNLESLVQTGWGQLVMDLGSWAALPRRKEYALELSVRMIRADIPGWLKKALFFWSWNIGNAQQYRLNFSY